jgi:hypothetical protein
MGAIVLIVCSVDMSHLALDESTERLLYFDDSEESAEENGDVAEEEPTVEAEEPVKESVEEPVQTEQVEKPEEQEQAGQEEPISFSDSNDDFEEDFISADEFMSAIYEAGDEGE